MRMSRNPIPRTLAAVYIDFFRTTPMLVQIVFFFFLLPTMLGIRTSAFVAGCVALSLNYGAFFADRSSAPASPRSGADRPRRRSGSA